jgi:hypothetical protein
MKRGGRKMNKSIILVFFFILGLYGCSRSPSEHDIQTAIAQTMQAKPTEIILPSTTLFPAPLPTDKPTITTTYTYTPTEKPTNTITLTSTTVPTNTRTPRPTKTITNTRTPRPTPTDTPTPLPPATQTALAVIARQTQVMLNAQATQTARAGNITATVVARNKWATQIAPYGQISRGELISYANSHKGEKIVITGRVFNIVSSVEFQMYYDWTYDAIYVRTRVPFSELYENNFLTVYGTIGGEECFKNAYGADICQPLLEDAFYVK